MFQPHNYPAIEKILNKICEERELTLTLWSQTNTGFNDLSIDECVIQLVCSSKKEPDDWHYIYLLCRFNKPYNIKNLDIFQLDIGKRINYPGEWGSEL